MSLGNIGFPALAEFCGFAGRIKTCRFQLCNILTPVSSSVFGSSRCAIDCQVSWLRGKMDFRVLLRVLIPIQYLITLIMKITEMHPNVIFHDLNR